MSQPEWMNNGLLFKHSIRGEYYHQNEFDQLYQNTDSELILDGFLQLDNDNEFDKNAVSVWAENLKIGHLSKANAVKFRKKLGSLAKNKAQFFTKIKLSTKDGQRVIKIDIKLSDDKKSPLETVRPSIRQASYAQDNRPPLPHLNPSSQNEPINKDLLNLGLIIAVVIIVVIFFLVI